MRRALLLASLALLTACGSSSGSEGASCDQQYWDGTIGTCLPEGWHVVSAADLQSRGSPREVAVAFQADDAIGGRFPLVTVTTQSLTAGEKTADFDQQSRNAVKTMPAYTVVDEREVTVDEETSTLHVFTAQPIAEQPVQRFYQLSVAHDGQGFTLTGVLPLTVDTKDEAKMKTLLTHVTFEKPKDE